MLSLNWRMTLTIVPLFPVFIWVRSRFRAKMRVSADAAREGIGKASATLTEHLAAVPQIQILGATDVQIALTVEDWTRMIGLQWKQRWNEVAFSAAIANVLAGGILLVLTFGVHEYPLGVITLGTFFAFYAYVTRIFEPISTAMELYSRTQRTSASVRRVREVLETSPSVQDLGRKKLAPSSLGLGLACKNVSFSYTPEKPVLRDISFHIHRRECVALIGKSGSGKSTLSRLMARVSDPTGGDILLNGRSVKNYRLEALRQAICYVPQHPVLFSGTIRKNLLYANGRATEKEIQEAVEAAQLLPVLAFRWGWTPCLGRKP
jgi:ABC-type multidrug transport system fused ATPase/permease subunit